MRGLGTIVLSAILSGFIAGVVQLEIGMAFNAHEEFIAAIMALCALVILVAILFGVALLAGGTFSAINRIAIGIAVVLVVALAALEGFAFSQSRSTTLSTDGPILGAIIVPGLLTILLQWWFVRRHLRKHAARSAAAA